MAVVAAVVDRENLAVVEVETVLSLLVASYEENLGAVVACRDASGVIACLDA